MVSCSWQANGSSCHPKISRNSWHFCPFFRGSRVVAKVNYQAAKAVGDTVPVAAPVEKARRGQLVWFNGGFFGLWWAKLWFVTLDKLWTFAVCCFEKCEYHSSIAAIRNVQLHNWAPEVLQHKTHPPVTQAPSEDVRREASSSPRRKSKKTLGCNCQQLTWDQWDVVGVFNHLKCISYFGLVILIIYSLFSILFLTLGLPCQASLSFTTYTIDMSGIFTHCCGWETL